MCVGCCASVFPRLAGFGAEMNGELVPIKLSIPTRKQLLAMFKEQRPDALNREGELYREEYLKLVVSIMKCRVLEGTDMAHANNWESRCSLLKEQLKQRDYKYIFPSVARIKQEVIKEVAEMKSAEELMFTWSDYSRVIVLTAPGILQDNPTIKAIVARLLVMGGPIAIRTAMKLKNGEDKCKIAESVTQAFKRAADPVTQDSDRLLGTDLETIQTRYYLTTHHDRYLIFSPLHEGAPSD